MSGSKIFFVYRKRLINIRLENSALSQGRAIFEIMIYQEGYVYHIKDEYLKKVQSEPLKFP